MFNNVNQTYFYIQQKLIILTIIVASYSVHITQCTPSAVTYSISCKVCGTMLG